MANLSTNIWRMTKEMEAIGTALVENGGEVTPEIEEALIINEENQLAVVDSMREFIAKTESECAYLGEEAKRLQQMKKSRENAIKKIKGMLKDYMVVAGIKSIEGTFCKVTLSERKAIAVDEEEILNYFAPAIEEAKSCLPDYIKVECSVLKTKAAEALDAGKPIPTYENSDVAMVRKTVNESLLIK